MSVFVLTLAKIAFLVLLYLFLLWALRTVVREVRGTAEPAGASPDVALHRPPQMRVVEPREIQGTLIPLAPDLTFGRSDNCGVTLADTYASSMHARVVARGDDFFIEDAGSRNGTFVNRRQITGPTLIRRGDTVQIGRTVMEVVK